MLCAYPLHIQSSIHVPCLLQVGFWAWLHKQNSTELKPGSNACCSYIFGRWAGRQKQHVFFILVILHLGASKSKLRKATALATAQTRANISSHSVHLDPFHLHENFKPQSCQQPGQIHVHQALEGAYQTNIVYCIYTLSLWEKAIC